MKIKHLLLWVGVPILLLVLGYWGWSVLTNPRIFPVKTVKVFASYEHMARPTLQKLLLPELKRGLFTVDIPYLQRELLNLPWVYAVNIHRTWPDTMVINIREQKAIARWSDGALINEHGQIFIPPRASLPQGLPVFIGPTGQEAQLVENYQLIAKLLSPLGLSISELRLDDGSFWQATLDNGIVLLFGSTDIVARCQRLVDVYPKIIAAKAAYVQSVDLRYGNGLAIRWKNGKLAAEKGL